MVEKIYSVAEEVTSSIVEGAYEVEKSKTIIWKKDKFFVKCKKKAIKKMVDFLFKEKVLVPFSRITREISQGIKTIPVDRLVNEIMGESRNVQMITGNEVEEVIVGQRPYFSIQKAMTMEIPVSLDLNQDGSMISRTYNLKIRVVPWFDGILLVPKEYDGILLVPKEY